MKTKTWEPVLRWDGEKLYCGMVMLAELRQEGDTCRLTYTAFPGDLTEILREAYLNDEGYGDVKPVVAKWYGKILRSLQFLNEQEEYRMEYLSRRWVVRDESDERTGFCCLAIRETESMRLVCDLADVPDDVPGFVDRAWEEARMIAFAPQLLEMLEHLIYATESRGEAEYSDEKICREAVADARELIARVKGRK